jgi:hypothetical protein
MTDRNRILQRTAGGLDVFTHYLGEGCKNGLFRNPYRQDGSPSCKLYKKETADGEKYVMKDYGDSQWYGDCFWLVAKLSSLDLTSDFMEVLRIIDKDLNLFILDDKIGGSHQMMQHVQTPDEPKKSGQITAKPVYQMMTRADLTYWHRYGIHQELLTKYHVKSVLSCKFTRVDGTTFSIRSTNYLPMFAYLFNDGRGQKFYRPGAQVRFLYSGNLPRPYIFGLEQLPANGDVLYITGGEKDVMSLAARGFNAISLNSETARPSETVIAPLSQRFKNIVFLYDSDETGKRESALRVEELRDRYSVHSVTLPLAGTKQEKDISDFFSMGHTAAELSALTAEAINI